MPVGKNWDTFVDAVSTMRMYQKNYSRTLNKDHLTSMKESESRVDFMLKSLEQDGS